jgi:NADPH:quinone reductase-like Zn-dependent oxidoreductase
VVDKGDVMSALYQNVWPLLSARQIDPVIDSSWPIEKAGEAMAYVAENRNIGKVLLQVAG